MQSVSVHVGLLDWEGPVYFERFDESELDGRIGKETERRLSNDFRRIKVKTY